MHWSMQAPGRGGDPTPANFRIRFRGLDTLQPYSCTPIPQLPGPTSGGDLRVGEGVPSGSSARFVFCFTCVHHRDDVFFFYMAVESLSLKLTARRAAVSVVACAEFPGRMLHNHG